MRSSRSFQTVDTQEEMKAKMDIYQEKMEAAIHFIWTKLEETIDTSCVDQKTEGLHKELDEKIDETQMSLQAVKTSLQETLADMRNDLGIMLQVEA
jgi:hypothetical protein